jgi:hypothetical protein
MTAAFEAVCRTLQLVDRDDPLTEIVARRVIDVAGTGERDPGRLRELVLMNLNQSDLQRVAAHEPTCRCDSTKPPYGPQTFQNP